MTTYFDTKAAELRALRATQRYGSAAVVAWTNTLLADLAMACAYTDDLFTFPPDLRDTLFRSALAYVPETTPPGHPAPDFPSEAHAWNALVLFVEDAHDVFHAAHQRGWAGGDNPQAPLFRATAHMEERCAELLATAKDAP